MGTQIGCQLSRENEESTFFVSMTEWRQIQKGRASSSTWVTTETYETVQRTGVMHSSTYTLLQYLEATGREPPEHCLQADEDNAMRTMRLTLKLQKSGLWLSQMKKRRQQ